MRNIRRHTFDATAIFADENKKTKNKEEASGRFRFVEYVEFRLHRRDFETIVSYVCVCVCLVRLARLRLCNEACAIINVFDNRNIPRDNFCFFFVFFFVGFFVWYYSRQQRQAVAAAAATFDVCTHLFLLASATGKWVTLVYINLMLFFGGNALRSTFGVRIPWHFSATGKKKKMHVYARACTSPWHNKKNVSRIISLEPALHYTHFANRRLLWIFIFSFVGSFVRSSRTARP